MSTPGKRKPSGSRLPGFLFGVSLVSALLLWPAIWLSLHNPEQTVMTMEEYMTKGSSKEWLLLKDCCVPDNPVGSVMVKDGAQIAGSQVYYYPLKTAGDDTRPIKIFVKPKSWSHSEQANQMMLGKEGESPVDLSQRATDATPTVLQDVSGVIATGFQYSDVKKILRASKGASPDAVLLLHNNRPLGIPAGLGLLCIPPGFLALGLLAAKHQKRGT